jgi:hypothetical protein
VNFNTLKLNELTNQFNEMAMTALDMDLKGFKPVKKFRDLKAGVARCNELHSAIQATKKKKPTLGRKSKLKDDAKISILVEENPKRGNAKQRFGLYKEGMLVSTYKDKVGDPKLAAACIRWDVKKGFIKLS